jgi:parallel beta-helix repeat protein
MRRLAAPVLIVLLLIPFAAAQQAPEPRGPRPEVLFGDDEHYVTLTFYSDNSTLVQEIITILTQKNVSRAVFFVDPSMPANSSVLNLARQSGFDVLEWSDKSSFDEKYPPSSFNNITLSDRSLLGRTTKMSDLLSFCSLALHSANSSIIAFTPPVPPSINYTASIDLLDGLLQDGGRTLVYTSEPAANSQSVQISASSQVAGISSAIGTNTTSSVVIDSGSWNISRLHTRYPADVALVSSQDGVGYLVDTSIIVGEGAQLDIADAVVWISSPPEGDNDRRIEVQGNLTVTNSYISSWDSSKNAPDENPYHQRPFIFADEANLEINNSTVAYMGFMDGGPGERSTRAAITVYESNGFSVTNSTLSFNFDSLYARNSSGFTVEGSKIYANARTGIDIRSGAQNIAINGNHVHDNGYEGVVCIECSRALISGNVIEHNREAGIKLVSSNFSGIRENELSHNEKFGIFLRDNSSRNAIQANTITESRDGIELASNSNNNLIFENVLARNDGAIDVDDSSTPNQQRNNRVAG